MAKRKSKQRAATAKRPHAKAQRRKGKPRGAGAAFSVKRVENQLAGVAKKLGVDFKVSGIGSRYLTLIPRDPGDASFTIRIADHPQKTGGGYSQSRGERMGEADFSVSPTEKTPREAVAVVAGFAVRERAIAPVREPRRSLDQVQSLAKLRGIELTKVKGDRPYELHATNDGRFLASFTTLDSVSRWVNAWNPTGAGAAAKLQAPALFGGFAAMAGIKQFSDGKKGWYIVDANGQRMHGPFGTPQKAQAELENRQNLPFGAGGKPAKQRYPTAAEERKAAAAVQRMTEAQRRSLWEKLEGKMAAGINKGVHYSLTPQEWAYVDLFRLNPPHAGPHVNLVTGAGGCGCKKPKGAAGAPRTDYHAAVAARPRGSDGPFQGNTRVPASKHKRKHYPVKAPPHKKWSF